MAPRDNLYALYLRRGPHVGVRIYAHYSAVDQAIGELANHLSEAGLLSKAVCEEIHVKVRGVLGFEEGLLVLNRMLPPECGIAVWLESLRYVDSKRAPGYVRVSQAWPGDPESVEWANFGPAPQES